MSNNSPHGVIVALVAGFVHWTLLTTDGFERLASTATSKQLLELSETLATYSFYIAVLLCLPRVLRWLKHIVDVILATIEATGRAIDLSWGRLKTALRTILRRADDWLGK